MGGPGVGARAQTLDNGSATNQANERGGHDREKPQAPDFRPGRHASAGIGHLHTGAGFAGAFKAGVHCGLPEEHGDLGRRNPSIHVHIRRMAPWDAGDIGRAVTACEVVTPLLRRSTSAATNFFGRIAAPPLMIFDLSRFPITPLAGSYTRAGTGVLEPRHNANLSRVVERIHSVRSRTGAIWVPVVASTMDSLLLGFGSAGWFLALAVQGGLYTVPQGRRKLVWPAGYRLRSNANGLCGLGCGAAQKFDSFLLQHEHIKACFIFECKHTFCSWPRPVENSQK